MIERMILIIIYTTEIKMQTIQPNQPGKCMPFQRLRLYQQVWSFYYPKFEHESIGLINRFIYVFYLGRQKEKLPGFSAFLLNPLKKWEGILQYLSLLS